MMIIFKKTASIRKILLDFGLVGLMYYSLEKFNLINKKKREFLYGRTRTLPQLQRLRVKLNNKIFKLQKNKVFYGPYKGIKIINDFDKVYRLRGDQILGVYEQKIQESCVYLQKKYKLKNIVNFGTENGYHSLGLIKNCKFKKAFCFEKNKTSRKILIQNFKLNNVLNKLKCFGEADFKIVFDLLNDHELKKTLFIIDIEGDEYKILNNEILNKIKNSSMIIENHDFALKDKKKVQVVKKSLKKIFNLKIIENSFPNIENFLYKINLKQDELILNLFNDRKKMNWYICEPKN